MFFEADELNFEVKHEEGGSCCEVEVDVLDDGIGFVFESDQHFSIEGHFVIVIFV